MSSPPQNGTKKRARVEEEEERPGPSTTRNIAALAADKSKPQTTPTTTTTTTTTTATTASNNVSASRRPSAQVSSASAAFPPPSIFRNEAFPCFDDITLQVAAFLVPHLASPDAQFIEIEAKLGRLVERHTGLRLNLPVKSETILLDDGSFKFESDMTMGQHRHFNQLLNGLVERGHLKYLHRREIDHFYKINYNKIRVSVDQKTGSIIPNGVVDKRRVADLNIYMPNNHHDYRISVNLEYPAEKPADNMIAQFKRQKDRLSYTQDVCAVDLTQVKTFDASNFKTEGGGDYVHELEVEFRDTKMLLAEKQKQDAQQPNKMNDLVQSFLYSVRHLSRKSIPHTAK